MEDLSLILIQHNFLKARISVPLSYFYLRSIVAKIGIITRARPWIRSKRRTTRDYLLNLLMTFWRKWSPKIEAKAENAPIQKAYWTLRVPYMIYVKLDTPVENMIIYMLVDEATVGGTPKLRRRGLKIAPPPKPRAPETQPPSIDKSTSWTNTLFSKLISPFWSLPTFFFNSYSFLTVLTPAYNKMPQITRKLAKRIQYHSPHISMLAIDENLELPRSKVVKILEPRRIKHKPCLKYYLWLLSFSIILSTF